MYQKTRGKASKLPKQQKNGACRNFYNIRAFYCGFNDTPIKLPEFLKDGDLICYEDFDGVKRYGVFFGDMKTCEIDSRGYIVRLYENAVRTKKLRTKEEFFDRIFYLHDHIEYPRLDVVTLPLLPKPLRAEYKTLKKLYDRYNEK